MDEKVADVVPSACALTAESKQPRRRRQWEDVAPVSVEEPKKSRWGLKDGPAQDDGSNDGPVESHPKKKKSRWASADASPAETEVGVAPTHPLQLQLDELDRQLAMASEAEKPAIHLARADTIKKLLSFKLSGGISQVIPQQVQLKVPLTDDMAPNGLQSVVGLVIGTRGMTQKMLEAEAGCKISVRGKGSSRSKMYLESEVEDEEPCHVLIKGPSEEAIAKTKALLDKLLDFNDPEGEALRSRQRREGHILNGTLKEDSNSVDLQKLLTGGTLAAPSTTGYGQATRLIGIAKLTGSKQDDEYNQLMAELGEGADASSASGAGRAENSTTAPPPPWASTGKATLQQASTSASSSTVTPPWGNLMGQQQQQQQPQQQHLQQQVQGNPAAAYQMMQAAQIAQTSALGYPSALAFQQLQLQQMSQFAMQQSYMGFPPQEQLPFHACGFAQQQGYPGAYPGFYANPKEQ